MSQRGRATPRELAYKCLRIAAMLLLLVFVHLASILAWLHFTRIFRPYSGYTGDLAAYATGNAIAVVLIGAIIFTASWVIFILSDTSRIEGMWRRFARVLARDIGALTRADKVFAGMLAAIIAILLYLFLPIVISRVN